MSSDLSDEIRALLSTDEHLYFPVLSPDRDKASDDASEIALPAQPAPRLDLSAQADLIEAIRLRVWSISFAINNTVIHQRRAIEQGVEQLESWIRDHDVVRVIGAGRALHAAAMPANRLAHAGADVHMINDVIPLPNSLKGGGMIAASASGKTAAVLEVMSQARERNPAIRILGIADRQAETFRASCDIFIGIEDVDDNPYDNPLRALADTGEYVISEVLDAMVVAAGKRLGLTDEDFRQGHEDLGPTGPYQPRALGGHAH